MRTASVSSLSVRDRYDVAAAGRLMCNGLDLERLADAVVPPEPQWHDGLLARLPGWYGDLARCLANGMPIGVIASAWGVHRETVRTRIGELETLLNAMRVAHEGVRQVFPVCGLPAANPPASRRPAVTSSWVSEPDRGGDYGPVAPKAAPLPECELITYTVFEVYANGQLRSEFATEKQARRAASNLRPYCESVWVEAVEYVDAV